jgi:hypothetical protein
VILLLPSWQHHKVTQGEESILLILVVLAGHILLSTRPLSSVRILPIGLLVAAEESWVEMRLLEGHHRHAHSAHTTHHAVIHAGADAWIHARAHAAPTTAHTASTHTGAHVPTHHATAETKITATTAHVIVEAESTGCAHVTPEAAAAAHVVIVKSATTSSHVAASKVPVEATAAGIESTASPEAATTSIVEITCGTSS